MDCGSVCECASVRAYVATIVGAMLCQDVTWSRLRLACVRTRSEGDPPKPTEGRPACPAPDVLFCPPYPPASVRARVALRDLCGSDASHRLDLRLTIALFASPCLPCSALPPPALPRLGCLPAVSLYSLLARARLSPRPTTRRHTHAAGVFPADGPRGRRS